MALPARLLRPRASGGGFDPRKIANLAVWLDASNESSLTLNGSTVSEWRDLSGNGRHATQATAASQPTYTAGGLNGKAILTASGSQTMATAAFPVSDAATVFFVGNMNSGSNQAFFQVGGVNTLHSFLAELSFLARRASSAQTGVTRSSATSVFTAVFNTTLSRIFIGNAQGTDNTATTGPSSGSAAITLFGLSSTVYLLNGTIAEFIYFQRQLSALEQRFVRNWLSSKWSVSL